MDAKENVRKQILRELQVGHDCNSPHIVTFYGAFQNEARDIVLCMEYMDCGYVSPKESSKPGNAIFSRTLTPADI